MIVFSNRSYVQSGILLLTYNYILSINIRKYSMRQYQTFNKLTLWLIVDLFSLEAGDP